MKQRKLLAVLLNVAVIVLATTTWAGSIGSAISALEVASLLGVLAFSLMWVHYVIDVVAPQGEAASHDFQYYLSRGAVLLAIVTHPLLVNWYLVSQGFGYPPTSYEGLLGAAAWVVILGWLALFAFVSFELRGKLSQYMPQILYANIIAMFLVLIHGFVAGMFVINGWYAWVWLFYLVTFSAIAVYRYRAKQKGLFGRYIALGGIIFAALGGFAAGVYSLPSSSSDASDMSQAKTIPSGGIAKDQLANVETTVTREELAARDGKGPNDCWVALSGTVYDLTGNNKWQNGIHIPSGGEATCGRDLTSVISGSPHGSSVLSNVPQVGSLAT